MTNLGGVVQMLQKEQDRLSKEMKAIRGALSAFGATYSKSVSARGKISAAGRARIAAAQRARWAKVKGRGSNVVTMPKKRIMSADARKRIAAAQRARWAKAKAGKKTA
jgi:hypothetical protein